MKLCKKNKALWVVGIGYNGGISKRLQGEDREFCLARDGAELSLRRSRRRLRQSKTTKHYWVYIMTNANNTVLYTGVTHDLERRVQEHKSKTGSSFTDKYNVTKLVFCERLDRAYDAIGAEKKIEAGSRAKKIQIIESMNPQWRDLYNRKIASLCSQ
jgi:putative endonuclease